MDIFTLIFWIVAIILMIISLVKNKRKTFEAMKKSKKMMGSIISDIVAIVFLIGIILTIIPPETIESVLGSANVYYSTFIAAVVGSITLIPAFVAFPLAGSFLDAGASIIPLAAFLTTLTMVGLVTFPLEKKEFGMKFALSRNLMSFGFAIVIALTMGVIL